MKECGRPAFSTGPVPQRSFNSSGNGRLQSSDFFWHLIREAAPPPTKLLVDALRALPAAEREALSQNLLALTERMGIADEPAGLFFEDERVSRGAKKRR